jgi:hypothetical protein
MDNFSLFLSQQTDKQQNFRLHDEQMVNERRLPWLPFPVRNGGNFCFKWKTETANFRLLAANLNGK